MLKTAVVINQLTLCKYFVPIIFAMFDKEWNKIKQLMCLIIARWFSTTHAKIIDHHDNAQGKKKYMDFIYVFSH